MPKIPTPFLHALFLAWAVAEGGDSRYNDPTRPATPFIAALNEARREYLALVGATLCPEAQSIESALQRENPDERFFLLWPAETAPADFLCGNWPALLDPERYSPQYLARFANRTAPDPDRLGFLLKAGIQRDPGGIANRIAAEVGEEEHREFLSLHLASLVPSSSWRDVERDRVELADRADRWLAKHPRSPYADFVRGEIRIAYRPAPYGFGGSLLAGAFLPVGDLGRNMERRASFGFACEFLAHEVTIRGALVVDLGSELDRDLTYDGLDWRRGGDFSMSYGELQLGLEAIRRPKTGIEPFLSYGFVQMKNGDAEDSLEKAEDYRFLQNFRTFGAGIRAHWYFENPQGPQIGYAGLVLGRRFFDLEEKFPGMGGGEWYLEIHLGARFRKQVRKLD